MRTSSLMVLAGALAVLASGCGSAAGSAAGAPVLQVVTSTYPYAQAVAQIGGNKVDVTDVVPGGVDPLTYRPTTQQDAQIRAAGLVVEVGGGFQPAFEEAARQASRVVETSETVPGPDPFVWLDPTSMESAVDSIAAAMAAADPPAAQLFKSDAGAYNQLVGSDGIDYQSTLATCPKTTIVTADGAFSVMAKDYYLHDIIVGDRPAAAIVSQLDQAGVSTVFAETWTDNSLIGQVASEAHAKVVTLDTLTGSPPGGWPKSSYIELLEANLGLLSSALNCDDLGVGN